MSVCGGWVGVKILSLVEGVLGARCRRCPSWPPTLLSWLSLHVCSSDFSTILSCSLVLSLEATHSPNCPKIVSFFISLSFLF